MSDQFIIQNEDRILRPVTLDDAEFIVKLRNQKHAKGFIHSTSFDVEKQRAWLRDYFQRENEYYWIITTLEGIPIGTTSLYNYNKELNQIESGRWIKLPGYDVNSFSGHLQMRDFIFDILKLDRIVSHVVTTNKQVLKYQIKILGLKVVGTVSHVIEEGGEQIEETILEETRDTWEINKKRLLRYCGDATCWKILKQGNNGDYYEVLINNY